MQVFLETERLVLRRFTAADLDQLVALDADPEVMRFISGGTPTPRAVIEHDIYEPAEGYRFWAAIERASGDFLGWVHFRPPAGAGPGEVELGYRLRRAAWGRGYATEASRALIRKGFSELGVQRVVAFIYEDNLASRRVMEKLGMTLVRTYRPTPEELAAYGLDSSAQERLPGDYVEYALEKVDWERQEAAGAEPAGSTGTDHHA